MDIKLEPDDYETFPETPQIDINYTNGSSIFRPCQNDIDFAIKQELDFSHRPLFEPLDDIKCENTKTEVVIKGEGDFGHAPHIVEEIGEKLFSYITTFHCVPQNWDSAWIPKHIIKEEEFAPPFDDITVDELDIKQEIAKTALVAVVKLPRTVFSGRYFVCYICYDVFATSAMLKRHRIQHGEPLFVNSSISFNTFSKKNVKVESNKQIFHKNNNVKEIELFKFKCKDLKLARKSVLKNDMCNYKTKPKVFAPSDVFKNKYDFSTGVNFRKNILNQQELFKLKPLQIFEEHECLNYDRNLYNCLISHKLKHPGVGVLDCKMCAFKCRKWKNMSPPSCVFDKSVKQKSARCDYQCKFFQRLKLLNIESSRKKPFICKTCSFFY